MFTFPKKEDGYTLLQLVKKTFYHNLNYSKSAKCLFKISLRLYDINLS